MERMTKVDENMAQAKKMLETIVERDYELQKEVGEWRSKCYILEKENKKLKLENAKLKDRIITDENFEEKLDKENKKLKEELSKLKEKYGDLDY